MERKQFTFYESFYTSISRIRNKTARCDAYDAICVYALKGIEPDLEKLSESAAIAFTMAKPPLDSSRRKAGNGKAGRRGKNEESNGNRTGIETETNGIEQESNAKQTESNGNRTVNEKEKEKEGEKEKEKEIENECSISPPPPLGGETDADCFESFWRVYPRKTGKEAARKAWRRIAPDAELYRRIIVAVEAQKRTEQWRKKNGEYIPNPSTWLNRGEWDNALIIDALPTQQEDDGLDGILGGDAR